MMDVSGSMTTMKKYVARVALVLAVRISQDHLPEGGNFASSFITQPPAWYQKRSFFIPWRAAAHGVPARMSWPMG